MDSDGSKKNKIIKREKDQINFLQRYVTYVGDVFSPIWIRYVIQADYGNNWFILGSRYSFLFHFRLFLVILYITYEVLTK